MQRVLIVDDQRDVRQVLRAGLETLGPDVHVTDVPSGEEAMLILPRQAFNLLIADVRLPGISGLELRSWAQINNPDLKLIFITGATEPRIRRQVMDAPVDAYFFKPIEMTEFLALAEVLLGRRLPTGEENKPARANRPAVGEDPIKPDKHPEPPAREKTRPVVKATAPDAEGPGYADHPTRAEASDLEANGLVFSTYDTDKKRQQAMTPETMSTRLARFRSEFNAISTIILDEAGQVVARAGVLPDARIENELLATLIVSIRVSAKASRLLGRRQPASFMALHGPEYDLYLAPIGESWGLMAVVAPPGTDGAARLGQASALVSEAAENLLSILGAKHIPPAVQVISLPDNGSPAALEVEPISAHPDLDALFESKPFENQDVDAFWETMAETEADNPLASNSISYARAVELGLAPETSGE